MLSLLRLTAFRNRYLLRGLLVWGGLRLGLAAGGAADPILLVEILLLLAVAATVLWDARRRQEDLFLGNLAIPAIAIGVCALPLAIIAECILA